MRHSHPDGKQRGSALIISLLILVVLTLIGVTSMGTSSLEEKMAGNSRDMDLAFQAAEAALREGENWVNSVLTSPAAAFNGANQGLYTQGSNPDVKAAGTWNNSIAYGSSIAGLTSQPKYIIELIGAVGNSAQDVNIQGYGESSGVGNLMAFRVTARGTGGTDNSVVLLQTNFGRRF